MTTAAAPATNDATKPETTPATPAPTAAPAPAATPDKAPAAPAVADPKPGIDPAAPAADPAPAAGADVGDDDEDISIIGIDDDEPAPAGDKEPATAEGGKPAAEPAKDAAPVSNAWAKERDAAADAYIKKIEGKLAKDKDGKPLSARQKQAAIDDAKEKFLSKLARYPSLTAALIAGISAQDKIGSGKYKAPLPDDATDEELSAWRKDNDIPEDAKGYKLPKVQGQEWSEGDKPNLDLLLGRMHEKNASQAQVDAVLTTYRELVETAKVAQKEQQRSIDKTDTAETQETLRGEYEGEFKPAMTLLKRLVDDAEVFPDEVGKVIGRARDPDTGKRLINNPEFAKFLINYARDLYGEGHMRTGSDQAAMNSEKDELVKLMNTDIDAYNYKPWRNTGMTASQRLLEINRADDARGRGRRAA